MNTATRVVPGAPTQHHWMAGSERVDTRSDIDFLGGILYELPTGASS